MENPSWKGLSSQSFWLQGLAQKGKSKALQRPSQKHKRRQQNRRQGKKDKDSNTSTGTNPASALFGPALEGKVNQPVCADIGADIDVMDDKLLQKLASQQTRFEVFNFTEPAVY